MTREEYEVFKSKLMERFYWCNSFSELNYLTKEKGYRYLFRCTHYKHGKFFWIFDKSEALLTDVAEYESTILKNELV